MGQTKLTMGNIELNKGSERITILLVDDCDFNVFFKLIEYIEKVLNISFDKKVDDIDSLYYSFKYKNIGFVLTYHVYDGIKLHSDIKGGGDPNIEGLIKELANEFKKAI